METAAGSASVTLGAWASDLCLASLAALPASKVLCIRACRSASCFPYTLVTLALCLQQPIPVSAGHKVGKWLAASKSQSSLPAQRPQRLLLHSSKATKTQLLRSQAKLQTNGLIARKVTVYTWLLLMLLAIPPSCPKLSSGCNKGVDAVLLDPGDPTRFNLQLQLQ